jgi:hypothetical protein
MKKLMNLFKLPSAEEAARIQLANAKRELLNADADREHATLKAEYQRGLIVRLTRMLNNGELV